MADLPPILQGLKNLLLTYNFFALSAAGLALVVLLLEFRLNKIPWFHALIIMTTMFLLSRFGSRILYCSENLIGESRIWNYFELTRGGMSLWGGFYLCVLLAIIYARSIKYPVLSFLDILSIPTALALATGRFGCLFTGCCRGFSLPKNLLLPRFIPRPNLFPTPLFEILGCLLITFWLLKLRQAKQKTGLRAGWLLMLFGLLRFILGFTRTTESVFIGLNMMQLLAIPVLLIGLLLIVTIKLNNNHFIETERIVEIK